MHSLFKLAPYLHKHRGRLILAMIGTGFLTALSLLPPLLIRYLVDHVLIPGAWHLLPMVAAGFVVIPVSATALRFVTTNLIVQTSHQFIGEMRLVMYERVLSLSARYHGEKSSGTLIGRLMDDVNMLQQVLTTNTIQILFDIGVFVVALSISFSISVPLALILCVVIVVYVLIYRHFSKKIKQATQEYRHQYDQITGRLQETLSGVRQVRIFGQQEGESQQFLDRMEMGLSKSLSSSLSSTGMNIACSGVTGLGSVLIMFYGAIMVIHGQISAGDLLAMNVFVWMAVGPAANLTAVAGELQETMVSLRRILQVLTESDDVPLNRHLPRIQRGKGAVRIENLWFSYTPQVPIYQGLSLDIAAGTTVALVGPTGCGKTTLASLLMRYWVPQQGSIFIDGIDISSVRLRSVRELFGVVLQNSLLFDGTLAENIAYGWPDAPAEAILKAAHMAELSTLIERLPHGLNTVIGTHGVNLSVGEKQRVSIARAAVKDPVILVMDEATAALDSDSEALIQKALNAILTNRTSFIIAHRLTTITKADLILVIDKGNIIDRGSHHELMSREYGLYQQLYKQLIGEHTGGLRQ